MKKLSFSELWLFLLCIIVCKSQKYNRLFDSILPAQSEILTLQKIVNSTPIAIFKNQKRQTFLQNQPFEQLNEIISLNITYSEEVGFVSEWSRQKVGESDLNKVMRNTDKLIQEQKYSPIVCKSTQPEIIFTKHSSFLIGQENKLDSSKIIIKYQDLLHEDDLVLDVWKDQDESRQKRILIIMGNGDLVVATPVTDQSKTVSYTIERTKISNELKDAEFNTQRYQKQNKLYILSNQVQIQISLRNNQSSLRKLDIQNLTIGRKVPNQKINDFQWVWNTPDQPMLLIVTKQQAQLYDFDQATKTYKCMQQKLIGIKQMADNLHREVQAFMLQGKSQLRYQQAFFIPQTKMIFIVDNSYGLIACYLQKDSTIHILKMFSGWTDYQYPILIPNQQGTFNKTGFYTTFHNQLRKHQFWIQGNRVVQQNTVFRGTQVPNGQLMLASFNGSNLIFMKAQTKISAFKSWAYPKSLNQQSLKADNFFVFGNQFVSVQDNKIYVGQYSIINQQITCSYNSDYNQTAKQNVAQKTYTNSEQKSNTNQNSQQIPKEQQPNNKKSSIFIEYLSQCNPQILLSPPYSIQSYKLQKLKYCRYKKIYTQLYLQEQKQITNNDSSKIQVWLIVIFVVSVVILATGVGIWLIQKRKIGMILEEQGLPVGSQDFETQPGLQNNFNFKFN